MDAKERAEHFIKVFPTYAPLVVHNGRLYGTWVIGNLYKRKNTYYGSYPYKVKERIYALFPDCPNRLHLFSGTLTQEEGVTYDIKEELKPTICDDVRNVKFHKEVFKRMDLVISDPPYEASDFEKYSIKPFNKQKVIRDLGEIMRKNSYLVWLDTRVPIYNKKVWKLLGYIALVISTNTRVRMLSLFEHT